jgi:hypothetical protein
MVPMTARNPDPIISRLLEKNGEMLYVVVERLNEPEVHGELFRLRAHFHAIGAPRNATWSNVFVRDETGNKYDLRLSFTKFLFDKRDEGWKSVGGANLNTLQAENDFWRLDL